MPRAGFLAYSGDFGTGFFFCSPCGTGSVYHVALSSQQNTPSNLCPQQGLCHKLSLCYWYHVVPAPQKYTPIKSVLPAEALTPVPPLKWHHVTGSLSCWSSQCCHVRGALTPASPLLMVPYGTAPPPDMLVFSVPCSLIAYNSWFIYNNPLFVR